MSDKMTPEQRRHCMQSIRGKDTRPELLVRRFLHAHGFRYRLHNNRLPGHPDIVLRKYRSVIFVNGCFWHGHEGCKYYKIPQSRTEYWKKKIEVNQARDLRERIELRNMGWHVIQVWECQLKRNVLDTTLQGIEHTLIQIYLQDHKAVRFTLHDSVAQVAEDDSPYFPSH